MTEKEIADLIETEFLQQTLGVTEQYLQIHEPVYQDGSIKIERIDDEDTNALIVYLPVKDEYFHFAVYIDRGTSQIINIGTESHNLVCLRATCETLTADEIQSLTNLQANRSWNKGDLKPHKKSAYSYSHLEFTPNPEPDSVEDKLKKLLAFLQKDKPGVLALAESANAYVQIIMDFHAGNQLLGAASLDVESLTILSELKLKVKFDFAAWGNPFL